jgi:chemotaxis signal transduction protein
MASSNSVPLDGAQPSSAPSDARADTAAQPASPRDAQLSPTPGERYPEFLTFSCDGIACATPLDAIREALMSTPAIASLPDSPEWFLGVIQLRTEIVGVADIRSLLLGQAAVGEAAPAGGRYLSHTGHERAIIVGTGARSLALLVESIGDIVAVRRHEVLDELIEHPAFGAIAPRYRLGLLAPDGHPARFALVALDTLLADMLTALTDPEAASYA